MNQASGLPFGDEELLPISALQHLLFCERQCALVHLEGAWEENRLTAEGQALHERVHAGENETRGDRRLVRGVRLRSQELGLVGVADMVELHRVTSSTGSGASLPGIPGRWIPYPVEYKRGRPKKNRSDEVQLCAQALCLEEMMEVEVAEGALFYGQTRKRLIVSFDRQLRKTTKQSAERLRRLVEAGKTPSAPNDRRCRSCSLAEHCLPDVGVRDRPADAFLQRELRMVALEIAQQEEPG